MRCKLILDGYKGGGYFEASLPLGNTVVNAVNTEILTNSLLSISKEKIYFKAII